MIKSIYQDFSQHRYFYLWLLLLGGLMSLTLHSGMQGADGRNYLRWTHSLVMDQDLHLLNDFGALGGSYRLTPTGFIFERVNIGTALAWVPFYGLAMKLLPPLLGQIGSLYPADGPLPLLWVNFTSWLYPILGGILTFVALRRRFSMGSVGAALVAVFLGTPVLFYMASFPLSSHPIAIFLASLLLYLWLADEPSSAWHFFIMGIVSGWLMLVASYNIVFFLLPGLSLLKEWLAQKNWRRFFQHGLAVGLGGLLGFLPQMIVFWFLFGSPFYSPYSSQLLWQEPYLGATLFSTFHGLFFFAPVLLLVIPGLWQLRRTDAWLALSLGLVWLCLSYIVSINVAWWAGSSFGNRYFLTLTPFFALGLAAFIQINPRWTLAFVGPCVLWTVGLYLQFLNGVGLTSDSLVYPATEIAWGQLSAYAHILTLLPRLTLNRPWSTVPFFVLPLFVLILVGLSRLVYAWAIKGGDRPNSGLTQGIVLAASLGVILFVAWAGWRGEQTKAVLASQGFYDQPHEVVVREIKEVAGRSGLVTRAMYHQAVGQPDQAAADLKRASTLWKANETASPTRLYLGLKSDTPLTIPTMLHLDYPGSARLIGYEILAANPKTITGELYWEKLVGEKSKAVVTPIVRAFDRSGNNLGNIELESPFPAEYIPAGGLFKDTFTLDLNTSGSWIWLAVNLAEDPAAPPINESGEPESGVIGSLNTAAFPPTPLTSTESSPGLIAQPILLLGDNIQPGQTIPVQLLWQTSGNTAADPRVNLKLMDAAGNVAAQQEFTLYDSPITAKDPGWTVHNSTLCLPTSATLPPGEFHLNFAWQPPQTGTWLDNRDSLALQLESARADFSPTICNILEADFARRYEAPTPQHPLKAAFDDQIVLLGYDFSVIPQEGSVVARVVLYWRAQANIVSNYLVRLQLLDTANQPLITHTGVPANGARPTSTWLNQELIVDEHTLSVPTLAPGEYHLALTLLDEQSDRAVESSPGQFSLVLQKLQIP